MRFNWKIIGILILLLLPLFTSAQSIYPEIKIFSSDGKLKKSFFVLNFDYEGALSLASGDFDNDGKKDLIVSTLDAPRGEIWNIEGKKIYDFFAFDKFRGGMEVAAGNLDGQGGDEIIVGASYNGGPHIRGFDSTGYKLSFFGFNENQRSGIRVFAIDLGNDKKAEIIGFSSFNQDPKLRIFGNDGHLIKEIVLSKEFNKNGIEVTAGDFDGDGNKEIAVTGGYGNLSKILIFNNNLELKSQFFFDKDYIGGLNLSAGDINNDGKDELIITKSFKGDGKVYIYSSDGWQISQFVVYDNGYEGIETAVGDFDGDGKQEIAILPKKIYRSELKSQEYKFIEVDLTNQTLYYWQDGRKLGSFLISSGLPKTPTPKGNFKIYKKRPLVSMSWYYGPNNPSNYNLPNVPWVASFSGPYTIHGTYWHNNFGHPMSHGCINMKNNEAKIIYDFVDSGTPVIIY